MPFCMNVEQTKIVKFCNCISFVCVIVMYDTTAFDANIIEFGAYKQKCNWKYYSDFL